MSVTMPRIWTLGNGRAGPLKERSELSVEPPVDDRAEIRVVEAEPVADLIEQLAANLAAVESQFPVPRSAELDGRARALLRHLGRDV